MATVGRAIVVLGMHRSGTSSVTGLLERCGVWLGRESEMTGASSQNPKGFFERRDLRNICDALLFSVAADWWRIADFGADRIPQATLSEEGARFASLAAKMSVHGTWAVKEPRLCLLFPLLRQYLDDPICLIVYRDPLAVAKSLRTRNGFSLFHGLALWETYMRAALTASEGYPRVIVSYDRLIAGPADEVEALIAGLGGHGVKDLAVNPQVVDFISPQLSREARSTNEAEAFLSQTQRQLWTALSSGEGLSEEAAGPSSARTSLVLKDFELQQDKLRETMAHTRDAVKEARKKAALDAEIRKERKVAVQALAELEARNEVIRALRRQLRRAREEPMKSLRRKYATRLLRVLADSPLPFSDRRRAALRRAAETRDPRRND